MNTNPNLNLNSMAIDLSYDAMQRKRQDRAIEIVTLLVVALCAGIGAFAIFTFIQSEPNLGSIAKSFATLSGVICISTMFSALVMIEPLI